MKAGCDGSGCGRAQKGTAVHGVPFVLEKSAGEIPSIVTFESKGSTRLCASSAHLRDVNLARAERRHLTLKKAGCPIQAAHDQSVATGNSKRLGRQTTKQKGPGRRKQTYAVTFNSAAIRLTASSLAARQASDRSIEIGCLGSIEIA